MADKTPKKPIEDYQELSPNMRKALAEAMVSLSAKGNNAAAERLGNAVDSTVSKKKLDPSIYGTIGLIYTKDLELYPDAGLEKHLPTMLGDEKKATALIKALREASATREQARPEPSSFIERILIPSKESDILIKNDEIYRAALEEIRKAVDNAVSDSFRSQVHTLPKVEQAKPTARVK